MISIEGKDNSDYYRCEERLAVAIKAPAAFVTARRHNKQVRWSELRD